MTIPASNIVKVNPGVLNAGGEGLVLNALYLTENALMPNGKVLSFAPGPAGNLAQNVAAFFGENSAEATQATIYFQGYLSASLSPSAMLFAKFNNAASAAFLNSGPGLTLAIVNALSAGTLTLSVGGTPITSASIDLSSVGSMSAAAAAILAGFTSPGFTVAWNATIGAFVFTDTATGSASTLSFATGTLATSLLLTSATGALLSQGANVDTPASALNNAIALNQNWSTMVTLFEPNLAAKEAFAAWFSASDDAYLWLAWDSDIEASEAPGVGNTSFGAAAMLAAYNGVACIGGDPAAVPVGNTLAAMVLNVASFVAGSIASINFLQLNGRITLAFLQQAGMLPTCLNFQTAANLKGNGYSYYGGFASRNQGFDFFYDSNMPGEFDWIDTYIDDIWLDDQFTVTLMNLLTSIGSAPYNASGYASIRAALVNGPIKAALNFGAIRAGVALSATQAQEVNIQAGSPVDQVISTQGYYLQINDPGPTARQERTSPIINFWYTDGGSIQQITISAQDIL